METGPVYDRCWSARCDRGAPVDRVRAWPVYGDYLESENQRLGRLSDRYTSGPARAWEGYSGAGPALGDVPVAPVRDRAEGARVITRQERLMPQGWLVDVIV